jgi:hypothetical protein
VQYDGASAMAWCSQTLEPHPKEHHKQAKMAELRGINLRVVQTIWVGTTNAKRYRWYKMDGRTVFDAPACARNGREVLVMLGDHVS